MWNFRFIVKKLLIRLFFSESERMLLILAVETRKEFLEKIKITDKTIDHYSINFDIECLNCARNLFSTNLFR